MTIVQSSPVVAALLSAVGGLIAILNRQRQIVAVNDRMLEQLGIARADFVEGLRPGEMIGCIHAHEMPGGCGTSRFCSTCGAAIAIVTSLDLGVPAERKCVVTVAAKEGNAELCLSVRSTPIQIDGEPLLMLLLQDVSGAEWRDATLRTFFHDINNVIMVMEGTASLIDPEDAGPTTRGHLERIRRLSERIAREVKLQSLIIHSSDEVFHLAMEDVSVASLAEDLSDVTGPFAEGHGVRVQVSEVLSNRMVHTDRVVLLRVLTNMFKNAIEASEKGDMVRMSVEECDDGVAFSVWNRQVIPEDVARRVFQRHFSTKDGVGRGFGTYGMKLLGERILKGRVEFTSSAAEGTTFCIVLPRN